MVNEQNPTHGSTVIEALLGQSLASLTVTLCKPADTLLNVVGEVQAPNEPLSSLHWYVPVPPPKVAVMDPLWNSLQPATRPSVNAVGSRIVPVVVAVQLLASVTVYEYVPAAWLNVPVPL